MFSYVSNCKFDSDEKLAERHRLKYKNGKEFINQLKSIYERSKYEKTIN